MVVHFCFYRQSKFEVHFESFTYLYSRAVCSFTSKLSLYLIVFFFECSLTDSLSFHCIFTSLILWCFILTILLVEIGQLIWLIQLFTFFSTFGRWALRHSTLHSWVWHSRVDSSHAWSRYWNTIAGRRDHRRSLHRSHPWRRPKHTWRWKHSGRWRQHSRRRQAHHRWTNHWVVRDLPKDVRLLTI